MFKKIFTGYLIIGLFALMLLFSVPNNDNSLVRKSRYSSVNVANVDIPSVDVPQELYISYPSQLSGMPEITHYSTIHDSLYINLFKIPNYFLNDLGYFGLFFYPYYNPSHDSIDWVFELDYFINRGFYFDIYYSIPIIISYEDEYNTHMVFDDTWISSIEYIAYVSNGAFLDFDFILASYDGRDIIEHSLSFTFSFHSLTNLNNSFDSIFTDNSGGSSFFNYDDNYLLHLLSDYDIYVPYSIIDDVNVVIDKFQVINSYNEGVSESFYEGFNVGYLEGYNAGYGVGFQDGEDEGYNGGYEEGYNVGYEEGYGVGFQDSTDELTPTIESLTNENSSLRGQINSLRIDIDYLENRLDSALSGEYSFSELFWSIGSIPFETIKSIWNFNFLGINLTQFFTGLITCLLLIYLIKKLFFK